jgi:hypothetical protein
MVSKPAKAGALAYGDGPVAAALLVIALIFGHLYSRQTSRRGEPWTSGNAGLGSQNRRMVPKRRFFDRIPIIEADIVIQTPTQFLAHTEGQSADRASWPVCHPRFKGMLTRSAVPFPG